MAPGSTSHHIFSLTLLLRCTFRLQISLCNQSIRDWQPLHSIGCKLFVFVQVLVTWRDSPTGLISWFSNWGKYLPPLCYITLSYSREHQRKAPRPRGNPLHICQGNPYRRSQQQKDFWRRCRGEIKSRSIQVSVTNSSLAFTFFASCLSFSSPPLHICRFHLPFSFAVFICLLPFSFASFLACLCCCLRSSRRISAAVAGEDQVKNSSK